MSMDKMEHRHWLALGNAELDQERADLDKVMVAMIKGMHRTNYPDLAHDALEIRLSRQPSLLFDELHEDIQRLLMAFAGLGIQDSAHRLLNRTVFGDTVNEEGVDEPC